nr:helix-turn-helix transcriptional regulator [Clostridium sp. MCC353]
MVTLAEHFNLSESYLSGFMKEHLKVNFSAYLQNLRLSKACSMLENSQKNIDFIASECGYSSSHVFRRAFKRQYGVTPVQYRECQCKK